MFRGTTIVTCVLILAAFAVAQDKDKTAPTPADQAAPAQAVPAAPPAKSFATVVSLLSVELNERSCTAGQMIELGIATPFTLGREPLVEDARLRGRIFSCNHDAKGHLAVATLTVEQLVLADGRIIPVEAVLQALGSNPPPKFSHDSKVDDIGFGTIPVNPFQLQGRNTSELAARGNTDVGQLNNDSHGSSLRHVSFENMPLDPSGTAWVIASDDDALRLPKFAQMVVRFRIAKGK